VRALRFGSSIFFETKSLKEASELSRVV